MILASSLGQCKHLACSLFRLAGQPLGHTDGMAKKRPDSDLPSDPADPPPDPSAEVVANIVEQLRPLAVPIAELVPDPTNARTHDERNLDAIRGSLAAYGQRKPVVVNRRTGVVEAGNGTLRAALALGWTHVAAVFVDDDPLTATGFAIADNRTAELAGWDEAVLQKLLAEVEGPNPELTRMLDDLAASFQAELDTGDEAQDDKAAGDDELPPELFQVLVTGREGRPLAEADQVELLEEFVRRGYQVKALTS